MPQFGILLQIDASHHPWLEDRGPKPTLLGAVDDATGQVVAARFQLREDRPQIIIAGPDLIRATGALVATLTK